MAFFNLTLEIPEWEAEGPIEAIRKFLEDPAPCWESLVWTATDLGNGESYDVILDDGVQQNQVFLNGPNGERIPLDYVPRGN